LYQPASEAAGLQARAAILASRTTWREPPGLALATRAAPAARSECFLRRVASEFDAAITAQPDLSQSQFDAQRPVINPFTPATTALSARAGGATTASVTLSDPTSSSGPITRQFDDGGKLDVTDTGGPTVTIAATSTGSLPLTLVALNTCLQFSSATVTFTITP
jgi:hypothetical protein